MAVKCDRCNGIGNNKLIGMSSGTKIFEKDYCNDCMNAIKLNLEG